MNGFNDELSIKLKYVYLLENLYNHREFVGLVLVQQLAEVMEYILVLLVNLSF